MRGVCALNFEAMSLLNDPQGVVYGTTVWPVPADQWYTEVLEMKVLPSGNQTWLAGKFPMNEGFNGNIT